MLEQPQTHQARLAYVSRERPVLPPLKLACRTAPPPIAIGKMVEHHNAGDLRRLVRGWGLPVSHDGDCSPTWLQAWLLCMPMTPIAAQAMQGALQGAA